MKQVDDLPNTDLGMHLFELQCVTSIQSKPERVYVTARSHENAIGLVKDKRKAINIVSIRLMACQRRSSFAAVETALIMED